MDKQYSRGQRTRGQVVGRP